MMGFALGRRRNLVWLLQLRHLVLDPAQARLKLMNTIERSLEIKPIDG